MNHCQTANRGCSFTGLIRGLYCLLVLEAFTPYLRAQDAPIQMVDLAGKTQGLVAANGSVPYTHLVPATVIRTVCHDSVRGPNGLRVILEDPICVKQPVTINVPQTDKIVPTVSNIRIVSTSEPHVDPFVRTELPDQVTASQQEFINCSDAASQQAVNLSISFQRSTSASLSSSVTNSSSKTIQVSAGPPWLKVSGSYTVGTSQTTGTVDMMGNTVTIQRTSSATVTLTKGVAVLAEIEVWPAIYTQTFHTTVVVDADLSTNDKFPHLSDMFPDVTTRSFPINGTITITDATDGKTAQFNDPTSTCSADDAGIKTLAYKPSSDVHLMIKP